MPVFDNPSASLNRRTATEIPIGSCLPPAFAPTTGPTRTVLTPRPRGGRHSLAQAFADPATAASPLRRRIDWSGDDAPMPTPTRRRLTAAADNADTSLPTPPAVAHSPQPPVALPRPAPVELSATAAASWFFVPALHAAALTHHPFLSMSATYRRRLIDAAAD